jgi:hypothetical protein
MSGYYTIGYLGTGLPVVGLGFAASSFGLFAATASFVALLGGLFLIVAIAGLTVLRPMKSPAPEQVHSFAPAVEKAKETASL